LKIESRRAIARRLSVAQQPGGVPPGVLLLSPEPVVELFMEVELPGVAVWLVPAVGLVFEERLEGPVPHG
jgi:hypothetical protein